MFKKRLITYAVVSLMGSINLTFGHLVNSLSPQGVLIDSQVVLTTELIKDTSYVKMGENTHQINNFEKLSIDNSNFQLLFLEDSSDNLKKFPIQRIRARALESNSSRVHTVELKDSSFNNYKKYGFIKNSKGKNLVTHVVNKDYTEFKFTPIINASIDQVILANSLKPKSSVTSISSESNSDNLKNESVFTYMEQDVAYLKTDDIRNQFDFYRPCNGEKLPLIIFIHGGGWNAGHKGWFTDEAKIWCTKWGYACASINYRLAPQNPYPTAIADAQRAVQYFRLHAEELGIDIHKIIALGFSAGAHTAAMLGVMDEYCGNNTSSIDKELDEYWPRVNAVINIAGPTDFQDETVLNDNKPDLPLCQNISKFVQDKTLFEFLPGIKPDIENYVRTIGVLGPTIMNLIDSQKALVVLRYLNTFGFPNKKIGYQVGQQEVNRFMTGTPKSEWKTASPIHYITSDSVPFCSFYGSNDVLVYISHGLNLHQKLNEKGVKNHKFYKLNDCDHFSFLNGENLSSVDLATIDTTRYDLRNKINSFLTGCSLNVL